MANRVREDEKNERIIRGLLKLPENRRCINCNSLGPQYVCTNFWTFVCTTCSGIHREFTHRVKSVSMAKFTSQEVKALQEGGNKHAREIYLKEWDPQRQSAPDGSNVVRLRDFIKHVYVDRRYTGERSSGKPPITKLEDAFQGGSRSPPYEDTYERRHSAMSSPGGRSDDRNSRPGYDERRSPGYDQEGRQNNDYGRSPARPEVVNDWRREDRFGNGRKDDDRRSSDGESRFGRSPESLKDLEASSPPVVRPVREILGDSVVPLRIGEPPKANSVRSPDGSVQKQTQLQTSASSNSLGSSNGNVTEVKVANTPSLIDFDDDPVPPVTTTPPQVQQTTPAQSMVPPASTSSDNNWASFDAFPGTKPSQVASNTNSLESALSQLSVPASVPGHMPGMPGTSGAAAGNPSNLINPNPSAIPFNNLPNLHSASPFPVSGQWPNMQHQQPSPVPASSIQSSAQPFTTPFSGASGTQPWNSTVPPNVQATTSTPFVGTSQVVSAPVPGAASTSVPQPPAAEVKPSGRRELPADLFAATYSPYHASVAGWHAGPPHGMGYAMPYVNAAMPMPSSVQSSKSINPFDLNEPSSSQVQTFPSMASLQGALPNMPPSSGLQRATSLGAPPSAWAPSHSLPFSSAVPPQQPSYASAMPPRAYMAPQVLHSMPVSGHPLGGPSAEGNVFGAANINQQAAGRFSTPANIQSPYSSAGGNPFG